MWSCTEPFVPPFAACARMKIRTLVILITSRLLAPIFTTVPPIVSAQNFLWASTFVALTW